MKLSKCIILVKNKKCTWGMGLGLVRQLHRALESKQWSEWSCLDIHKIWYGHCSPHFRPSSLGYISLDHVGWWMIFKCSHCVLGGLWWQKSHETLQMHLSYDSVLQFGTLIKVFICVWSFVFGASIAPLTFLNVYFCSCQKVCPIFKIFGRDIARHIQFYWLVFALPKSKSAF